MALTNIQIAWFQGFYGFFNGVPRPPAGDKRSGWDAAQRTVAPTTDGQGGYGKKA